MRPPFGCRPKTTVTIKTIFDTLPSRYIKGSVDKLTIYYFSIDIAW